ncbi:class I SAM-dependent methyltransferase [Streptomyces sp. NPDC001985]|uniref:class I SAM-dependent methyltransferase n=1 Tax=Streptomyces sp. NPDC001985 TaxID=3154406 RepID=UPI003317CD06
MTDYWNHNVHYHPRLLAAVPPGARTALDIGCGDGLLAHRLTRRAGAVTGIDRSPEMIRLARERGAGVPGLTFREADFLDPAGSGLPSAGYDFISAVAVLHHVPFTAALTRLSELLAPGGRLAVLGLGRDRTPGDWLTSGAGAVAHRLHARRHGGDGGPAGMPVRDAEMSWSRVRAEASAALPGCRYRRLVLWRYLLVWERPAHP